MSVKAILEKLKIEEVNAGGCWGPDGWIRNEGGKRLTSINPTTGETLACVLQLDSHGYDLITAIAMESFKMWCMVPAPQRGILIRDLSNVFRDYKEPLGELITLEMGKIRQEGLGEVQEMVDICDFSVGLSRQLYGRTMHSERPYHRMFEQWHPLGVVGIITAFNFPMAVWSWNAAIASVCGDTLVWKPSSSTPLCGIAIQHICNRVMADHGYWGLFNIAIGPGQSVGERMLKDPNLPLISFTGSTSVGKRVAEVVAGRLGRTILELGGNNAIIVSAHADLDMAVKAILFGAVGTAGQRCTSTRRIIVHRSIIEELTIKLLKAYKQVRIGDPLHTETHMGPLVNEDAVEYMMKALEQGRNEGGKLLTGGNRLPEKGARFVEPTLLKMPSQTAIVHQEIFAPILYILEYDSLEEAIALHNAVPQGLSSSIFTTRIQESETFLSHLGSDCGIANVNIGTSGAEIGGCFGGEKETGGGREAGSDAWKNYMWLQTNTINWGSDLLLAQGIHFDL